MAINKNHEFEELDGVKCAIVERNVPADRMEFLKALLELNRYTVVVVPVAPKVVPVSSDSATPSELPAAPVTYTMGVTNLMFNPVNAVFGRLLKTAEGSVVTLAYWQQKEPVSDDQVPYFAKSS